MSPPSTSRSADFPQPLRVAFVPGVMPDTWARRWRRGNPPVRVELLPVPLADQLDVLDSGQAEMCFLRLPVDRDDLHLVRLYTEEACVVAAADHPIAAFSEVTLADLVAESLFTPPDSVPVAREGAVPVSAPGLTTAEAVATVAAGTGVVILPRSVARLHQRKDVTWCPLADVALEPVALAWLRDPGVGGPESDAREAIRQDFVGVVRGRTARSSRTAHRPGPARARGRRR